MRLSTFTRVGTAAPHVGALCGVHMLDLAQALHAVGVSERPDVSSMKALLARGREALDVVRGIVDAAVGGDARFVPALLPLAEVRYLPPVPDPDKFLCVGKNYRAHLEELKRSDLIREMPQEPTGFVKVPSCLTGHDRDVVRPAGVTRLDYEPELVFVIGREVRGWTGGDALACVAGLTILNDLTCRDTQKREVASGSRFWTAKNAPGFGPVGPAILTMDEVRDPYDIWVTCRVNGETRMRVNTSEQIWKLDAILRHFTRLVPLFPGDLVSTGAPGGVAAGKANAEDLYLKPGDVVECAFESPAMVLRNRIVAPTEETR
jgi:2-keto-4-pentenoate hydratase/2-oxohepta-3-ene-1,7-dioic acid hydratase in catechol pathway